MVEANREHGRWSLLRARGPVCGEWRLRGSKSYTNRALVMAALAQGETHLWNISEGDDSRALLGAFTQMGIGWERVGDGLRVLGRGGDLPRYSGVIDVGAAGTTMRFLIALCSLLPESEVILRGSARMHQRPVGDLVGALRALGADIAYVGREGCPPVRIRGGNVRGSGPVRVSGEISSQFLTAMLQIAPVVEGGLDIRVEGALVSRSYVEMTLASLRHFGVEVQQEEMQRFVVPAQPIRGRDLRIEGDASGASYLWGLAALSQGCVRVSPLGLDSLQGDAQFSRILEQMGCIVRSGEGEAGPWIEVEGTQRLCGVKVDMEQMPDTAQTLAVIAAFAEGPTEMTGLQTLRHKETDRLAALCCELGKMGVFAEATHEALRIVPPVSTRRGAQIATYEDHRMAMAFAMAATRLSGMEILEAQVVSKSFPDYWACLRSFGIASLVDIPLRVILVGFMGSGKSVVARVLSERLGYDWIEADQEILASSGRTSIAEIFAVDGEPHFRLLERAFLASVEKRQRVVISTGGGAVMEDANVRALRAGGGVLCYLETPFEVIAERLRNIADRPLFRDGTQAEALYRLRAPRYVQVADLTIATERRDVEGVVEALLEALGRWGEEAEAAAGVSGTAAVDVSGVEGVGFATAGAEAEGAGDR
ncbi:3-phosphoshikimate 1-carboxyvinyltransferase [Myxococcota bacterium]|nr:3-phosphoshikimate 1-carboxyvinyltransferase [Myxococcota bacterium]